MICEVCGHERDNHPHDGPCTECHCSGFQTEHPQDKPPLSERFDEAKWRGPSGEPTEEP